MRLLIAASALLLVVGCGGGGSGSSPVVNRTEAVVDPRVVQKVKIGEANLTFPVGVFAASTKVILTETRAPRLSQPAFKTIQPVLTLELAETPKKAVTVEYPDAEGTLVAAAMDSQKPIGAWPVTRSGQKTIVSLDPTLLNPGRAPVFTVGLVLGLVTKLSPPDADPGLTLIGPAGSGRTIIFVHGLLQSADDLAAVALKAKSLGGYGRAYSFRYDYRASFRQAGEALASALKNSGFADKSVDLVGYSKGGLVARWALEQQGATKPVRQAVYLATPNQGCNLTLAGLYYFFGGMWLISPIGLPFPAWESDTFSELTPNSPALATLNKYRYQQNGDVDYFLFAGSSDHVVTKTSAQAQGTVMDDRTLGMIERFALEGFGHLAMDESEAVTAALGKVTANQSGLTIKYDRNPLQPDFFSASWQSAITLTNTTKQPLTIEYCQFEQFDRNGAWQGNYWFDDQTPPGVFFPHQRSRWGYQLSAGESVTRYIEFWPDESKTPVWSADPIRQARTSRQLVEAVDRNGQRYKSEAVLRLVYNDLTPAPPQTRASRLTPTEPLPVGRWK